MSKEQTELDKARELVSEVAGHQHEPVPDTVSDGDGALDSRFTLWRSFGAEHGLSVENVPGVLAESLKGVWEGFKEKEIHAPEEGR
jgi:hypothetical protein